MPNPHPPHNTDYRAYTSKPNHQRMAVEAWNRLSHKRKREGKNLNRGEMRLRDAVQRTGLRVVEFEHEIPTDPPAWIDVLVEEKGRPWYIDCDPYFQPRSLEERKQRILERKQTWAKEHGITLTLVRGTAIEMQAILELERLRQRGRRNNGT